MLISVQEAIHFTRLIIFFSLYTFMVIIIFTLTHINYWCQKGPQNGPHIPVYFTPFIQNAGRIQSNWHKSKSFKNPQKWIDDIAEISSGETSKKVTANIPQALVQFVFGHIRSDLYAGNKQTNQLDQVKRKSSGTQLVSSCVYENTLTRTHTHTPWIQGHAPYMNQQVVAEGWRLKCSAGGMQATSEVKVLFVCLY